MKITTKTGDKGETSLFGGRRVSKSSSLIELVGELDELQALLGHANTAQTPRLSAGWANCQLTINNVQLEKGDSKGREICTPNGRTDLVEGVNDDRNLQINRSESRDVTKIADQKVSPVTDFTKILARVIDDLYRMMSIVGFEFKCPGNIRAIDEGDVEFLEQAMRPYEAEMDKVTAFVRPGDGSELAARLNIARTVCRRVERRMNYQLSMYNVQLEKGRELGGDTGTIGNVGVPGNGIETAGMMLKYLNRLSDLLFVLAHKA